MGSADELCEDKVRIPASIVNLTLLEQEAILTNIDPLHAQRRGGEAANYRAWTCFNSTNYLGETCAVQEIPGWPQTLN